MIYIFHSSLWKIYSFHIFSGYHRLLWIDAPQDALIRLHKHEIIPPLARHICLDDPRTVIRFNRVLRHILFKYNLYSIVSDLHQLTVHPLLSHHTRALKIIDIIIVKLMQKADNNSEGK